MKIAIFGGSFDPPHIEHVRLAQSAVKSLKLDTLFIMPAHTPPHKKAKRFLPKKTASRCAASLSKNVRKRR